MSATNDRSAITDLTKAQRVRGLIAAITCISVYGIVGGLSGPLISLKMQAVGIDPSIIGANAAAMAGGIILISPFIPRLTAWLGPRIFLVSCLIVEMVLLLAFPLTENVFAWFVLRLLMGASVCGLFVISETWINQLVDDAYRGRTLAIYATFLSVGFAVGPSLIPLTGIAGWTPFLVAAGIVCLAMIPMALAGNSGIGFTEKASFSSLAFLRLAPSIALAVLVVSFFEMGAPNILPIYGVGHGLDVNSSALMATFIGGGGIVLMLPIGWLADKMDRMKLIAICALIAAASVISLPWIIKNPVFLYTMLLILGGTVHGIYACALAVIGARFQGSDLVSANAATAMIWGCGSVLGPAFVGISMEIAPTYGVPFVIMAVCALFGGFAILRQLHKR